MSIPLSYSLRARLLFFLLAAIVVGALVQGTIAYRSTLQQADDIFDSLLQRTALSLGTGDGLLSTGPTHARGAGTPFADDLIIQIWTPDGLRVFNSVRGSRCRTRSCWASPTPRSKAAPTASIRWPRHSR